MLELDEHERITDLEEKPLEPQSDMASIGVYVMSRKLLIELLETVVPQGRYDLVRDVFARYRKRLKIYGYKFGGFWRNLNNVHAYFDCNMEFLQRDVRNLFMGTFPYIKTKPKDEPPAKYNAGAIVTNCLVGSGAILNGNAHRSIIFRKVYTGENSRLSNAIIMEGTRIGNNAIVENAIVDKEVIIRDGAHVFGTLEQPLIVTKSSIMG